MEKISKGHSLTQSPDFIRQNIETLKSLFPTIVKEDKIDFEELRSLLDEDVEIEEEYYRFSWAGKSMARREATKPSTATLLPCKEESKNWNTTQNLFIEGDNLEVLKLLQKSYSNKIKMIYIDPPYNTGKDFVYKDNYRDNLSNYLKITGQLDEEGRKLSTNTESDGRYHSNWINMMYPRLKLARNLLKDDGIIFISIDDNESANLRKICDEIFGEGNFIADIAVVNNLKGRNDKRYIATANERLIMYVKSDLFEECGLRLPESRVDEFDFEDDYGKHRLLGLRKRGGADTRSLRPNMYFPLYINPENGLVSIEMNEHFNIEVYPRKSDNSDGCWRWGLDTVRLKISSLIGKEVNGGTKWDVFEKDYLETDGVLRRIKPKSVFAGTNYSTDRATKEYRSLMPDATFSSPKSVSMLYDLIEYSVLPDCNEIVLDFFAGSGTIAHALMQINSEGHGNIRYICVQLPEPIDSDEETYKNGFKNIADIAKERIRRAGDKIFSDKSEELKLLQSNVNGRILQDDIKEEISELERTLKMLDIGFKVFKLGSSNIKSWDGNPENLEETLFNAASNMKENRSEDDILYEILLKSGLDLSQSIIERVIEGKTVYSIGLGALFICLADGITTDIATGIGKWKEELQPATCRVIFKDTGFTDVEKTNSVQLLKRYGIEEVNTI